MALTHKQRAFIEYYLISRNAAKAARLAGYSEKTARSIGAENLTKPHILEAIQERTKEIAMQADEVLMRLTMQARGNMADFVTIDRNGVPKVDFSGEEVPLHLIKKLTYDKDGNLTRIELYDAHAALQDLGKAHGLFTERIDLTSGGQPIKGYALISPDDWDDDGDA